jgi:hypothetical protein
VCAKVSGGRSTLANAAIAVGVIGGVMIVGGLVAEALKS